MGTVAGWGRLSEGGQLPNILQYVSGESEEMEIIEIVSHERFCSDHFDPSIFIALNSYQRDQENCMCNFLSFRLMKPLAEVPSFSSSSSRSRFPL